MQFRAHDKYALHLSKMEKVSKLASRQAGRRADKMSGCVRDLYAQRHILRLLCLGFDGSVRRPIFLTI